MKKKIITLALAVVMCLSVITSVTAASNLNRVASTIPGTDIEYNYVENVTVQIPGTEVTYELTGVYEKVGLVYQDHVAVYEDGNWIHEVDFPVYRFAFLESGGILKINQSGEYAAWFGVSGDEGGYGDGASVNFQENEEFAHSFNYPEERTVKMQTRDAGIVENPKIETKRYETYIYDDGSCKSGSDYEGVCIAKVEFWFGYGGECANGEKHPYDLISFEYGEYWNPIYQEFNYGVVPADIEKIDISLLDVNYEEMKDYSIIEGANSVVNENALTIKADGDFDKFTGVKVDGELVDSSNYTATEGSTIIEFKADYLKTLDAGEHTVSVVFTDGEAATKFEITEDKKTNNTDKNENNKPVTDVVIPNTDYNTSVAAAFVAMATSGTALIGLKKKSK